MDKKIDLVLGIHCHQPVGNFEHVFEESYQQAYLPFVNVLQRHPGVKVVFHYSGVLLKWFKENHPEFLELLKKVIETNQCEVLGGGFYEPILISLPQEDKISQINLLSSFVKHHLNYDVKGMWLAERVWEQGLAKTISRAGMDYTLVDDYHFTLAGLKEKEIQGFFTTEEEGNLINIFPISEKLRYLTPFKPVQTCIDFLRQQMDSGQQLITLLDDGEKFGVWPGTNKWVYEEGWLENFFKALEDNPWINLTTLKEANTAHLSRGLIYLPAGSYKEMIEWSGGLWRNFFVKYPESNNMNKKMLFVSEKVKAVKELTGEKAYKNIEDQLFQGQCNDAYWHGVFGGLYLNYLRSSIYSCLIKAQAMAESLTKKKDLNWIDTEEIDFDKDGKKEIILSNHALDLCFDPYDGASLFEFDFKAEPFINVCDTLSRRAESYHQKIKEALAPGAQSASQSIHEAIKVKEQGLEKLLAYDTYRRSSLIDHIIDEKLSLSDFRDFYPGPSFANASYSSKISKNHKKAGLQLSAQDSCVSITKNITLEPKNSFFKVHYEIQNISGAQLSKYFAMEFNFSFLAPNADNRFYEIPGVNLKNNRLNSVDEIFDVTQVKIKDLWRKIELSFDYSNKARIWMFPINTVSSSEAGLEQSYQHSTIVCAWKLNIPKNGKWETDIQIEIKNTGEK